MKNKLILLIMAVPIILMFAVFSMTGYVSLKTDVQVAGIKFVMNDFVSLDLASTNELQLETAITPANATNKNVEYSFVKQNENDTITCTANENTIIFDGLGTVQIIVTTKDGNYKDSIIVDVTSSKVIDFEIMSPSGELNVGDSINFDVRTIPQNLPYTKVEWSSSNTDILSFSNGNLARIKDSGEVVVNCKLYTEDDIFEKQKTFNIADLNVESLATINGSQTSQDKTTDSSYSFNSKVYLSNFTSSPTDQDFDFKGDNELAIESLEKQISISNGVISFAVTCTFKQDFYGSTNINLYYLNEPIATLQLERKEFITKEDCSINGIGEYISKDATRAFTSGYFSVSHFSGDPAYSFSAKSSNSSVLEAGSVLGESNSMYYKAKTTGNVIVTITCYHNNNKLFEFDKEVNVVEVYNALRFADANKYKWRLDGDLTIGDKAVINQQIQVYDYNLVAYAGETIANYDLLEVTSSAPEIAEVLNGRLHIYNSGNVLICIKNKNGEKVQNSAGATLALKVVNGVNVYSYSDLVIATENNEPVVVMDNIMLGQKLIEKTEDSTTYVDGIDETRAKEILETEVKQMATTYDWTYYKNVAEIDGTPITEAPKINYCIEFTNNVYGNGFSINAEYITNIVDSTNLPLSIAKFTGPLNFVSVMNAASVKAQDNIAFLIKNDGITLENIELKGCDNVDDLTKLNYVGTTLEIMGDNVTLSGCNVQNGRNVVRIFGGEDADKQITVNIDKCVLKSAREFILKIGTNKYLKGELDESGDSYTMASPSLENYEPRNQENFSDPHFVETYVKTIVNLKNSMLSSSGIYAVGIESKFSGPCLAGKPYNAINLQNYGWYDLAGTSYASLLNLIGDVRMYDWKKLDSLDSSTLLETALGDTLGLKFDVKAILTDASAKPEYESIINEYNGENYVHGGIALYGGGKNYSGVTLSNAQIFDEHMVGFDILTDERQRNIMQAAAGMEPFRFFMYNAEQFSIEKQFADLADGTAYSYMNNL